MKKINIKNKERALRVKSMHIMLGILSLGLIGSLLAQPAPLLLPEPEFTAGHVNPVRWNAPGSPGVTINAWEMWVDTAAVGTPDWPDEDFADTLGPANIRIGPITTIEAADYGVVYGSEFAYPVGSGVYGRADDPLTSGLRYCYKVRYRWSHGGEFGFSDWSGTYCSVQDATPPSVTVDELPDWWNTETVRIDYVAFDAHVGDIDSVVLYYRMPPSTDWIRYTSSPAPAPHYDGFVDFSTALTGDGEYEFYIGAWDILGNGTIPIGTAHAPMARTKVDDTDPYSTIIETGDLPIYYTGWPGGVKLYFSAGDAYSGLTAVYLDTDHGGLPVTSIDSLFYPAIETVVRDSFTFARTENGEWNIRTKAVDLAGNHEDESVWDWTLYVDTRAPEVLSASVFDTTTVSHRYDVPANPGWTNSRTIRVVPEGAVDPLVDGYASGLDSVVMASNDLFTTDYMSFIPGMTPYFWVAPGGDGDKEVWVKLRDKASNISESRLGLIKLDTQAPVVRACTLWNRATPAVPTDTTVSLVVDITAHLDPFYGHASGIFFTQNPADLNAIPSDAWLPLSDGYTFTFEDYSPGDWMTIYSVARDSAGNVSEAAVDSIRYISGSKWIEILSVRDIDGPDTTGRYTDTTLVNITIRYGFGIDTLMIWDGSPMMDPPDTVFPVSSTGAMDTVTIVSRLTSLDGWHTIAVRGKANYDVVLTDIEIWEIELDLQPPTVPDFHVLDLTTHTEPSLPADVADTGWTNNRNVRAMFTGSYDTGGEAGGTGLFRYRLMTGTDELAFGPFPGTYQVEFTLPSGDGAYNVLGDVQDSAGNWASEGPDPLFTIRLDTNDPVIDSVHLLDASSLSPDYTDDPSIIVKVFGRDEPYVPAYVSIFENATGYPDIVRSIRRPFGSGTLGYTLTDTLTTGLKTVYVALMDKAGNISAIESATIIYNKEIHLNVTLYDYDSSPRNTQCTNSPTIGVRLDWTGTPPMSYILSETPSADPLPDDPRWRAYPADRETLFTITDDPSEGVKIIYGWLLSESFIVSEMDADTIHLDMTAPEMDEGFFVWDTTSSDIFPTKFQAAMGWSNQSYIWAQVPSAYDEGCGTDSIKFSGGIDLALWQAIDCAIDFVDHTIALSFRTDSIPLIMDTSIEGRKQITARLRDFAGNWGNPFDAGSQITINGGYDITPPDFWFLDVFSETETESITTVVPSALPIKFADDPAPGFLWKVCWRIDNNPSLTGCTTHDSTWDTSIGDIYYAAFPSELADVLEPDVHYSLSAVVIDSAGNPSALKTANLLILPDSVDFVFNVYDENDLEDTEYTGSINVATRIQMENPPDQMRFGESATGLGSWMPFSEWGEFTFGSSVNNMKFVYAQIRYGTQESKIAVDSIILDTRAPTVSNIYAFDLTTGDTEYATSREIGFKAIGASDPLPGIIGAMLIAEDADFSVNLQKCPIDLTDTTSIYIASEQPNFNEDASAAGTVRQDARVFWVKLLDRAENEAQLKTPSIVIDLDQALITNFPNPFNPNIEPTIVRVKGLPKGGLVDVSIYDNYGNLVVKLSETASQGSRTVDILWDGKNGKGDPVAAGVYVAVVDVEGEVIKRKIAVWKGGE